jgi:molybdate transport repressor ModE-like protein
MLAELRFFLAVAHTGRFTTAAKEVHLSQPALSAAIARLEVELGARLFDRGGPGGGRGGGTQLTAAGRALVPRALAALAAVDDGRRAVAEVTGLSAGEVHLGAGATVATYFLPPILASFRRAHPGIRVTLTESGSVAAEAAVARGDLDLAFVTAPAAEPWTVDTLVLVAAPGFPLPRPLAKAPFVTFPTGGATRAALDRLFPRANVVMELSGLAAVRAFVQAGVGVALVSETAVQNDVAKGTLVVVPAPRTPIRRPIGLRHRGAERLSPAAAALRVHLLAWAKDHAAAAHGASRSRTQAPSTRR